jgi:hypothetical protein
MRWTELVRRAVGLDVGKGTSDGAGAGAPDQLAGVPLPLRGVSLTERDFRSDSGQPESLSEKPTFVHQHVFLSRLARAARTEENRLAILDGRPTGPPLWVADDPYGLFDDEEV